jgi:predicted metal-dependent phosphoesterase TrpH
MHSHFSPDSEVSPEAIAKRCADVGLDYVAVTDHNSIEGSVAVKAIAPFNVIIGEEVGSAAGEITGLFLKETIPAGLTALQTVERIKDQGGLVSIPHPFDRFRSHVIDKAALHEIIPYIDIVEGFNSRNNLARDDRKAQEFARTHGFITSGVTDAHTTMEIGRTYVEMPEFDGSPEDFLRALAAGRIVGRRMTPLIHVLTTLTKIKKRIKGRWY